MPITGGKYISPNWVNGGPPALNAAELNAICRTLQADDLQIKDVLPGLVQSVASGVFLRSGQLVDKSGAPITVPASQLSDQVHIATGSYVGTGTYGQDNPCSLTFDFTPKIVGIIAYTSGGRITNITGLSYVNNYNYIILTNYLTNDPEEYCGFGVGPNSSQKSFGWKSSDEKTIYWYATGGSSYQYNDLGETYYYFAIG